MWASQSGLSCFLSKRVYGDSLDANNYFATFAGEKFPAIASCLPMYGSLGWPFFSGAMADASQRDSHHRRLYHPATVDGGPPLVADEDGLPGGIRRYGFTAVSVVPLPRTSLSGIIVDPGPDREPMTEDSTSTSAPTASGIPRMTSSTCPSRTSSRSCWALKTRSWQPGCV